MIDPPVKVGVIGCGAQGKNHLNVIRELPPETAIVSALCDLSPDRYRTQGRCGPRHAQLATSRDACARRTRLGDCRYNTKHPYADGSSGIGSRCRCALRKTVHEEFGGGNGGA